MPRGDLGNWLRAASVILADPRPHVHAMVAISLGSILLPLIGMRGAVSSFVSRDSGYGKSTMAYLAASIWGHPEKSVSSLNDTFNAVIHKAQFTGPLPTIFDDVRPGAWELVDQLLFRFSQGKEKSRLSGSAQLQDAGTFDGALILTSNFFLTEMVQQGHLNAAALARIVEHKVPMIVHAHDASAVSAALVTLKSNHAVFGVEWVRHVLKGRDRLAASLATAVDRLTTLAAVHPTDREARFQVATAAAAMVAALEVRKLGLPVDPTLARDLMVGKIRTGKVARAQAARMPQGVTLLVEFLDDQADSRAVVEGKARPLRRQAAADRLRRRQAGQAAPHRRPAVHRLAGQEEGAGAVHLRRPQGAPPHGGAPWVLATNVPEIGTARRRVLLMPCLRHPLDTLA
jgi:hypothetical protein